MIHEAITLGCWGGSVKRTLDESSGGLESDGTDQMRPRKHKNVLPGGPFAPERPGYKRLLGYASLLVVPVAIHVLLTPRRMTTRAVPNNSDVGSTGDALLSPQRLSVAEEVVDREEGWNGVARGLPSMPRSEVDIHVVFSTDCSPYQNYQSILLFHSAEVCMQSSLYVHVRS